MTDHYDVVVVGSGAGGGTLAHILARSGRRILLLERGNFLPRELANWDPLEARLADRYVSPETWYDSAGRPFQPRTHYFVGGSTKLSDAALERLRPEDFTQTSHGDGISAAWPVSYAEFEPWYTKAEWLYQVHGLHGEDPTEGPWSEEYPWPPVSHEPLIQQLADDLDKAGYRPFHVPRAIMVNETNPAISQCIRCGWCDGHPCLLHAKADTDVIAVRPLLGRSNVTLLVNAEVTQLATDPGGHAVTEVIVTRAGQRETYHGDIVILAAGVVNSAKILLRSASDRHPAGLANGSRQVGRNYMCHDRTEVMAITGEPHAEAFAETLGINDFYLPGREHDLPLGSIQTLGATAAVPDDRLLPDPAILAPRWARLDKARRAVSFLLTTEDVPGPRNYVTVDRKGGVRVCHTATNDRQAVALYRALTKMLRRANVTSHLVMTTDTSPETSIRGKRTEQRAGTCRFGTDPATSVLDVNCKAHEMDNLYVADASFFPSIGAVSPVLTTIANAIRVGDHVLERFR